MLKVNEEKLLHDYHILDAKKADNLAVIDADAKAFAVAHGYDEKTTADFVAFTEKASGYGLTADENAKLEILSSYIDEVEEPKAEEETVMAEPTETVIDGATLRVGVVNNI